jgi:hypothetical protein
MFASFASDTLYFAGHIKANRSVSFQYYLRFAIAEDGTVTGYSLTDPKGPYETKTKIEGSYNKKKGVMKFREINVLRTKANSEDELCFVVASLKVKKSNFVGQTLTGKFTGTDSAGNIKCARGRIKLLNTVAIKAMQQRGKKKQKNSE